MKKLTFKGMREAISLTYRMVKIGTWKIGEGKCYLRTEGIDTTLAGKCTKFGSNAGKLKTALKNMVENKTYDKKLVRLHETNPEQFHEPVLPPLWNLNDTIDTGIFIDAYMHLLFLGGMKAIA